MLLLMMQDDITPLMMPTLRGSHCAPAVTAVLDDATYAVLLDGHYYDMPASAITPKYYGFHITTSLMSRHFRHYY